MSNLTSVSNEASVSSSNRDDNGVMFSPQYNFQAPPNQTHPVKKKRNQPGHPDPDAEVIALSPKSLLATNRFVCEVCKKGFQRDQNLQLHRRGHNLPWKLKQRSNKDIIRKKVYVCPEISCVHHDPSRALGDLTGVKKHFSRKHGEKKWKCEKCSKKYAIQSDWRAHSKTCGTREYRCDCGTLFSRRDSFITHRAFCEALAEENSRSMTAENTTTTAVNFYSLNQNNPRNNHQQIESQFSIKKEQQNFMMSLRPADHIPPWMSSSSSSFAAPTQLRSTPGGPPPPDLPPSPSMSSSPSVFRDFSQTQKNPNPNTQMGTTLLTPYHTNHTPAPPHISATALLQKAAQMGSKSSPPSPACVFIRPHHQQQPATYVSAVQTTSFGLNLSSHDGFLNCLASYGNKAADPSTVTGCSTTTVTGGTNPNFNPNHSSLFRDMMMSDPGTFDHDHSSAFEDMTFGEMLSNQYHHACASSSKRDYQDEESLDFHAALDQLRNHDGNINDGMTRDFLGLRALSHSDILSMAGLSNCMDSSNTNACNNEQ